MTVDELMTILESCHYQSEILISQNGKSYSIYGHGKSNEQSILIIDEAEKPDQTLLKLCNGELE